MSSVTLELDGRVSLCTDAGKAFVHGILNSGQRVQALWVSLQGKAVVFRAGIASEPKDDNPSKLTLLYASSDVPGKSAWIGEVTDVQAVPLKDGEDLGGIADLMRGLNGVHGGSVEQRPAGRQPAVRYPKFKYSHLSETRPVLHSLSVASGVLVQVVGDGDWGCYEWVILKGGSVERHSDCGYGQSTVALRDGLLAFHGAPENEEVVS